MTWTQTAAQTILERCDILATKTSVPGTITRTYLTEELKEAYELVAEWMQQAGMSTHFDAAGNIVGRIEGRVPGLPALILGSHLDTVPDAGKYDGILGVITAISTVERLVETGRAATLPFAIEVIGFGDEEGVRFGATLLGSSGVAGTWNPDWFSLTDANGVSLDQAFRDFGLDPSNVHQAAHRSDEVVGYLECHIEQGPILERDGRALSTVSSIAAASRFEICVQGHSSHVATPYELRHDALGAAAEMILLIDQIARDKGIRANVGKIHVEPGGVNVIAGHAVFSLDVRAGTDELRDEVVGRYESDLPKIAQKWGTSVEITRTHKAAAVACDSTLSSSIAVAVEEVEAGQCPELVSYPGHDGMAIAALTDIAMLYVRCGGGISHSPDESVLRDDVALAVDAFTRSVIKIAESQSPDLVIVGDALIDGEIKPARVGIVGDKIVDVDLPSEVKGVKEVLLEPGHVLIPGIVDTHVHVNDPGRTHWEGFDCATRAALAGGVTTLIDMPLNSIPPTLTVEALRQKAEVARSKAVINVGFWGGIDGSTVGTGEVARLWDAGVYGFKCFLSPSGVEEFGSLSYEQLQVAMKEVADCGGLLIVHAEDPHDLCCANVEVGESYSSFSASRPASVEADATARVIEEAKRTGCRVHILHVSSGAAVDLIRAAKAEGVPITAETCPHYLVFRDDEIPDGNSAYKCCPPIRGAKDQDALWEGLADGAIDCIVSDHSPADAAMKAGGLATAWGGVSGLQVGFRAVLTEARRRGFSLAQVVEWMSESTANLVGLNDRGRIAPGTQADLVVVDPDQEFTVDVNDPQFWFSRNPISAYDGLVLQGAVLTAYVGGVEVDVRDPQPTGQETLLFNSVRKE